MNYGKFFIVCIFIFSHTKSFSDQNFSSSESLRYKEISNQEVTVLFKDVYETLLSEQQVILYNLMCACADFSQNLATLAKLNSLLTLHSAKIQGMTLGVINTDETLGENILFLRSLSETLLTIHEQYEQSLVELEQLYQYADPIVQEIFRDICNTIYYSIDQHDLFLNQLEEVEDQDSDLSIQYINDLIHNTPFSTTNPLHHQIIDKQSNLIIMLYKRASLNWQTAQLYFDMLNMYVNILDTYRKTID